MTFAVAERIDAAPAKVWHYLTDPALMITWMNGIEAMRSDDGGPLRKGGTLVFTARGKERSSTVIELQREHAMTLRSTQGPVTATYRYRMKPDGDANQGVRMTLEADCRARGPALLFMPLINLMIRRVDSGQLKALKSLVEGSAQG